MKHVSEKDLILHLLGDGTDTAEVERHLKACFACHEGVEALRSVLAAVSEADRVPERGETYGREVWQRVARRLSETPSPAWRGPFSARSLAFAGVMAVLVAAAFLAGRFWRVEQPAPLSARVRERVLLVALDEHLDRSQAVLIELVNAPEAGDVDISREQARASDLIADNRLYRQTASRAGERGVTSVLDELERLLLDVAHGPSRLSAEDLAALRQRINISWNRAIDQGEAEGLLFKVRVIGSSVRERGRPEAGSRAAKRKTT